MDFSYSEKVASLHKRVDEFMRDVILPAEPV